MHYDIMHVEHHLASRQVHDDNPESRTYYYYCVAACMYARGALLHLCETPSAPHRLSGYCMRYPDSTCKLHVIAAAFSSFLRRAHMCDSKKQDTRSEGAGVM
jgi:deoxycytidylate deaminase